MTYLKTILLFSIYFALHNVSAQVNSPTFQCVRSDTLFWSPAVNSCGPFISTDIYHSTSLIGPYSLIASIMDENITSFHHPVAGSSYYFLRSNNNCMAMTSLNSDTLNNLAPASTTLERVTVQDDGVLISWYDNNDAKTVGYIIYRSTAQGTLPIDTVFGVLEYLDLNADQVSKSESYYVLAIDQCGNTGLFDSPQNTIHLNTRVDFCGQFIELKWNPYVGWLNGNESVQIWLGIDGSPSAFEHQVQITDTLAYLTGIVDNRDYCITIIYKEQGRNVTSSSNTVCQKSDVITPLSDLSIRNVVVQSDGSIEVSWNHNANADLSNLKLFRDESRSNLMVYDDLTGARPLSDQSVYQDGRANTTGTVYYYQFEATDDCDTTRSSNIMSSILLNVVSKSNIENELNWSEFFAPNRQVHEIQLCRTDESGNEEIILSGPPNQVRYTDVFDAPLGGNVCYHIKAIHSNALGTDTLIATSNLVCVEQQIGIYVPNAFVPDGANPIFKPEFAVQDSNLRYRMQIFNRWGGKVFESSDGSGWDGRQEGTLMLPGVYFYLILLQQPDGTQEQKTGTLHLLR